MKTIIILLSIATVLNAVVLALVVSNYNEAISHLDLHQKQTADAKLLGIRIVLTLDVDSIEVIPNTVRAGIRGWIRTEGGEDLSGPATRHPITLSGGPVGEALEIMAHDGGDTYPLNK